MGNLGGIAKGAVKVAAETGKKTGMILNTWASHIFQQPTYNHKIHRGGLWVIDDGLIAGGMEFQFNPNAIKEDISSKYDSVEIPGLPYPLTNYVGGGERKINFTLFFDVTEHYTAQSWRSRGLSSLTSMVVPTGMITLLNTGLGVANYKDINDSDTEPSVEIPIQVFKNLVRPEGKVPPICYFIYGDNYKDEFNGETDDIFEHGSDFVTGEQAEGKNIMKCVATDLSIDRLRFGHRGNCTRATIGVNLLEYREFPYG